jgi:limonene-1,2-epoxide hydrolase
MTRKGSDETQDLLKAVSEHFEVQIKVATEGHHMLAERIDRGASDQRSEMRQ